MSRCFYCHHSYTETWSWALLLGLAYEPLLCQDCQAKLVRIEGEICRMCGRPFSVFPEQYRQGDCCYDCIRWEDEEEWRGVLKRNRSLYVYNDFLREMIAKLKYRGDAELIKAFYPPAKQFYKKEYKNGVLVPIPLSEERHYERGFNQAQLLAMGFGTDVKQWLKRTAHEEKQSKKDRKERLAKKENPFEVMQAEQVKKSEIVLVDDVYTTGSTVRYAAKVLLEAGAKSVRSVTLGR
jgi:competence protein ComFC